MLRVGITGTIASGKTSVSILLKKHGFSVFNSDRIASLALHKGSQCFDALLEILGEDVLDDHGDIDTKKMAGKIFADESIRLAVNGIVHPFVIEKMNHFFQQHEQDQIAFAEVPLLFEAGLQDAFDDIVVVTCDYETAVKRMMEDREYSREESDRRYHSQLSPVVQVQQADIVIENNGDLKALNTRINEVLRQLRKESRNGNQTA